MLHSVHASVLLHAHVHIDGLCSSAMPYMLPRTLTVLSDISGLQPCRLFRAFGRGSRRSRAAGASGAPARGIARFRRRCQFGSRQRPTSNLAWRLRRAMVGGR